MGWDGMGWDEFKCNGTGRKGSIGSKEGYIKISREKGDDGGSR
jgi:hypothetical protein